MTENPYNTDLDRNPANHQPLTPLVRRQGFWDRWPPELKEGSAHLVGLIMQRICGEASVAFRWSSV